MADVSEHRVLLYRGSWRALAHLGSQTPGPAEEKVSIHGKTGVYVPPALTQAGLHPETPICLTKLPAAICECGHFLLEKIEERA